MKVILVVEDELSIRSFICLNLRRKKYEVLEAETGEKALELFASNPVDVVLLDLMLPGMDGFAVCEKMRDLSPLAGIIMLTARSQEEDKIKGLIQGADDYITKPFSMTELDARIISLLRRMDLRSFDQKGSRLCSGPFELDFEKNQLLRKGVAVKVTPTEFSLIQFFIRNKNRVFTRNQILDQVWGENYVGDLKVVDVNIRRIRRKIEDDPANPAYLCTEWGYGYIWKE